MDHPPPPAADPATPPPPSLAALGALGIVYGDLGTSPLYMGSVEDTCKMSLPLIVFN